jgi:hypothetical protein
VNNPALARPTVKIGSQQSLVRAPYKQRPTVHNTAHYGASPMPIGSTSRMMELDGIAAVNSQGNLRVSDGRSKPPLSARSPIPAAAIAGQIATHWEGTPYQGGFGAPANNPGNAAELT